MQKLILKKKSERCSSKRKKLLLYIYVISVDFARTRLLYGIGNILDIMYVIMLCYIIVILL